MIQNGSPLMHHCTKFYKIEIIEQIMLSRLNETGVRIHLEKCCTIVHYFAKLCIKNALFLLDEAMIHSTRQSKTNYI
jgi:hypothetical protein